MKTLKAIAAVLAAFSVLAGSMPAAQAAERLTLLLDWFLNPDHAPLIVAEELGLYEARGLTVEMVAPADPNAPPKLVAAGKADLAITYQPQLHLQVAAGLPLVRIATLVSTPLNALVVLKASPIRTIADLKGRKIGYSVGGFEDALLGAMLEKAGLAPGDVTLINVNFALSPALLSGQVDAVIGAFRNFELNQLALEGTEGRAFYPEEEGVPPYDELILVTRTDLLADGRLPRFVDAVEEATLYLLNHPEESWSLFLRDRQDLDNALNRLAWRDTLRRFAHSPGGLDPRRYERFAAFLAKRGLIPEPPPLSTYAVTLQ